MTTVSDLIRWLKDMPGDAEVVSAAVNPGKYVISAKGWDKKEGFGRGYGTIETVLKVKSSLAVLVIG